MGDPPDLDEWPPGDDCAQCKSVIFDEITPKYVEVLIAGLVKCPLAVLDPPDGVYLLEQDNIIPCLWGGLAGPIGLSWFLNAGKSLFQADIGMGLFWFQHQTNNPCDTIFTNQLGPCGGDVQAIGGTADIFWGRTIGGV